MKSLALALALTSSTLAAADFVWIEGESPTAAPPDAAALGYNLQSASPLLSAGRMLQWSLDPKQAAERIPADGVIFRYAFDAAHPGPNEIWARIGFENARSPFEWRVDNGAWTRVTGEDVTSEIVALGRFFETGWLKLGSADLSAGKHAIEIRVIPPVGTDRNGTKAPTRLLFSLDAIYVGAPGFRPNGAHAPGAAYQSDDDKAAATHTFTVAAPTDGQRAEVALTGGWQVARWDESAVSEETRLKAPATLPDLANLFWYSAPVPGSLTNAQPWMDKAHRYLLRTRVDVPASAAGGAFFLEFQRFVMLAAVYVNGQFCGESRGFNAAWDCDVTRAIKPGQANEIVVLIKDLYYGLNPTTEKTPLTQKVGARAWFGMPVDLITDSQALGQRLDMPMSFGRGHEVGILEPVTFVATGPVYAEDVFAQPSVRERQLGLAVTLRNPGPKPATISLRNAITPWSKEPSDKATVAKAFAPAAVTLAPGEEKVVDLREAWTDPKLWWPDDPNLYVVTTEVTDPAGKVLDTKRTRFGFREWGWDKPYFTLNGVRWHFWANTEYGSGPADLTKRFAESGQNLIRFWNMENWGGLTKRQTLEFMDESGIAVRDSLPLDGQKANYGPGLRETIDGTRTYNRRLFGHAIEQGRAQVRTWRNHPSILIWSLENEVVYINAANLGQSAEVEPALRIMAEEIAKVDPTRPSMVDGGNALRPPAEWKGVDESVRALGYLPVNGGHYLEQSSGLQLRDYPDAAYSNEMWVKNRSRDLWYVLPDRPLFHGEIFFANGYSPENLSQLGGEVALGGRADTKLARSVFTGMMTEGYRWSDASAASHFWNELFDPAIVRPSWSPVAVLCRQWNWSFGSGQKIERTLKLINQTSKSGPIEVTWNFVVNNRSVTKGARTFELSPGGQTEPFAITLDVPKVTARTAGTFTLTAARAGQEVFRREFPVAILAPAPKPTLKAGQLAVLDPSGEATARLKQLGVPFVAAADVDALLASPAPILLVGRDAIPAGRSTDSRWLAAAAAGKRIVMLEQTTPLHFQAVPADFEITENIVGRIAFPEDLTHPLLAGLDAPDFVCWSGDHTSYRNPLRKATTGARSLLQCDKELGYSALAQAAVGKGVMVFNQTLTGQKLATDPVAQRLFDNALTHAAAYDPSGRTVATVLEPGSPLAAMLANLRVKTTPAADPVAALKGSAGIAYIAATPANLAKLVAAKETVTAFTKKGGWIILHGLTPEGLASFNTLVGAEHEIRPFTLERTSVALPRDPLAAGLSLRDMVMNSGEKVAPWMGLLWMADDVFTDVVDAGSDIAPFATLNGEAPKAKASRNPEVRNVVNGFTTQEFWRYIHYFDMASGQEPRLEVKLARPRTIAGFDLVLNTSYRMPRKLVVSFGDEGSPIEFACEPTGDKQSFQFEPREASSLTLELKDFDPADSDKNITGIDNFWLHIERPDSWKQTVHPLTVPAGLVRYPMGAGGIVLNQLAIKATETNPDNAAKKANITKVLLENLKAEFAGSALVTAGAANLRMFPIMAKDAQYNAYTTHRGDAPWFTDARAKEADLTTLPIGDQRFAGVNYRINDFSTSPVPTIFMLAGSGTRVAQKEVTDIAVGRKADALFFLHTFNATQQAERYDAAKRKPADPLPVVFRYRVNYADGKSEEVPVVWGEGVAHWLQKEPRGLKSAALAWSAPATGNPALATALWSQQWTNPRPDVEIRSVDILPGTVKEPAKWGAPAVLAITAATADGSR